MSYPSRAHMEELLDRAVQRSLFLYGAATKRRHLQGSIKAVLFDMAALDGAWEKTDQVKYGRVTWSAWGGVVTTEQHVHPGYETPTMDTLWDSNLIHRLHEPLCLEWHGIEFKWEPWGGASLIHNTTVAEECRDRIGIVGVVSRMNSDSRMRAMGIRISSHFLPDIVWLREDDWYRDDRNLLIHRRDAPIVLLRRGRDPVTGRYRLRLSRNGRAVIATPL